MEANKKFKNLKVYITGYDKFMKIDVNPSKVLVEAINKDTLGIEKELGENCKIEHKEIYQVDCDYVKNNSTACHDLVNKCNAEDPDCSNLHLIVHFGVYEEATGVQLESKCKNSIKDRIKLDGKINTHGPDSYECKLDLKSIVNELKKSNHNVKISQDAGSYLCNFVYYLSSQKFEKCGNVCPLFIHVPKLSICSTEECKDFFLAFLKVIKKNYISDN